MSLNAGKEIFTLILSVLFAAVVLVTWQRAIISSAKTGAGVCGPGGRRATSRVRWSATLGMLASLSPIALALLLEHPGINCLIAAIGFGVAGAGLGLVALVQRQRAGIIGFLLSIWGAPAGVWIAVLVFEAR